MTPTQRRLVDAMKAAVASGTWVPLPGDRIRFTRTLDTPEWARRDYHGWPGSATWPKDTYDQLVFLTVVSGMARPWSIILGTCRAPGGGRRDQDITFKRAFEILQDPVAYLDN